VIASTFAERGRRAAGLSLRHKPCAGFSARAIVLVSRVLAGRAFDYSRVAGSVED